MRGQNVNKAAMRVALKEVLFRPSLLKPAIVVRTVADIDWLQFRAANGGVQYVVFDKDNTLTAPYVNKFHPRVEKSALQCLQVFGKENVAILSNSAGTPDDVDFASKRETEQGLGIPVIVHKEKKPLGMDEVKMHFSTGQRVVDPKSIVMVGDRLFTDTVFGNLHGALTIHCKETLDLSGDNKVAIVFRKLENFLLRLNLL